MITSASIHEGRKLERKTGMKLNTTPDALKRAD